MSAAALRKQVEATLEACRDSLARLEEEFSAAEDAGADETGLARTQQLVVVYAQMVAPLREYLEQEKRGNRNPSRLASKIDGLARRLEALDPDSGLHPTPEEATELALLARGAQPE